MTMATKHEIFQEHLRSYLQANRPRKGEILTQVCAVTGMHRKAAIRKFKMLQMRHPGQPQRRGRSRIYTPDVTAALRQVWEAGNEVCGELLHPMINEYIDISIRDRMWHHHSDTTMKLRRMSEGTTKRRVGSFLKARQRRGGVLKWLTSSHLDRRGIPGVLRPSKAMVSRQFGRV